MFKPQMPSKQTPRLRFKYHVDCRYAIQLSSQIYLDLFEFLFNSQKIYPSKFKTDNNEKNMTHSGQQWENLI